MKAENATIRLNHIVWYNEDPNDWKEDLKAIRMGAQALRDNVALREGIDSAEAIIIAQNKEIEAWKQTSAKLIKERDEAGEKIVLLTLATEMWLGRWNSLRTSLWGNVETEAVLDLMDRLEAE